jgi:dolichyl-phosphate beta-glucosyltransferase
VDDPQVPVHRGGEPQHAVAIEAPQRAARRWAGGRGRGALADRRPSAAVYLRRAIVSDGDGPIIVGVVGDASKAPGGGAAPETLSLVIPAYEEEARLPALLDVLATSAPAAVERAGMELLEVVVVDDGSADRTREMLRAAGEADARLRPVLDFAENRGKGAAVAAGVQRARGDYVLLADVDLSTPLEELPKLTAALRGGADVAIGSRAVAGAVVERGPVHRKLTGGAFNLTVRALTGLPVRDTQNGFKLLPTDPAKRLLAAQSCPGFAFDVELLMRAEQAGLRIAEVPVLYLHDSRSSVRVGPASIQMLRDVSRLAYRLRLRSPRPGRRRSRRSGGLVELPADDPD